MGGDPLEGLRQLRNRTSGFQAGTVVDKRDEFGARVANVECEEHERMDKGAVRSEEQAHF